jgi:integrase
MTRHRVSRHGSATVPLTGGRHSEGGALYVDTLKNSRARTVPLVNELVPIVDRWSAGKPPGAWLFDAPGGGPPRESPWSWSCLGRR